MDSNYISNKNTLCNIRRSLQEGTKIPQTRCRKGIKFQMKSYTNKHRRDCQKKKKLKQKDLTPSCLCMINQYNKNHYLSSSAIGSRDPPPHFSFTIRTPPPPSFLLDPSTILSSENSSSQSNKGSEFANTGQQISPHTYYHQL